MASSGTDSVVNIWDLKTGENIAIFKGSKYGYSPAEFSPDSKLLACTNDDYLVTIWDIFEKKLNFVLTGHENTVTSIKFSPNDQILYTCSYDSTIKCWNYRSQLQLFSLNNHTDNVISISLSVDGLKLVSGSSDKTVRLWNLNQKREEFTFIGHKDTIYSVSLSPNSEFAASASDDNSIIIWNLESKRSEYKFYESCPINSVSFSNDSIHLVAGLDDQEICIYDIHELKKVLTITKHSNRVYPVTFSSCGNYIASGSYDELVKIFNISDNFSSSKENKKLIYDHQESFEELSTNKKYLIKNLNCSFLIKNLR